MSAVLMPTSPFTSPTSDHTASTRTLAVDTPPTTRRVFMDGDEPDAASLPTVTELLLEVTELQALVQALGGGAADDASDGDADSVSGRGSFMETPTRLWRRDSVQSTDSRADTRRRQSSFASPTEDGVARRLDLDSSFSSDVTSTPPRRNGRAGPPPTRVAALTKENISLLRAPQDYRRSSNYAGSTCGSQKSRTSVRTDGGAVFSRLYQPDFYKNRDAKLRALRDRQESFNASFVPKINHRSSVCSRDSAASSVSSMRSAKTDVLNVSSRLYDPDYLRKRSAKLQRMREERELRDCTFVPSINAGQSAPLKEKRERNRQRAESDDERDDGETPSASSTMQLTVRGDLRTVLKAESKAAIDARKRDATRLLEYAPDRGHSQSIYTNCGLDDVTMQPRIFEKPRWTTDMTPDDLVAEEDVAYRAWIDGLGREQTERALVLNLFERNIEVWRQLWRTIERSDVLVHLVDARCPLLHLSDQLIRYIRSAHSSKRVMILLTKADIVAAERVEKWTAYIKERYGAELPVLAYNRANEQAANASLFGAIGELTQTIDKEARVVPRLEDHDTLTVGFIGEPNVGKSSLLNSIFERKLVSVSATPGRTKHLQTHYFGHPELLGVGTRFNKVLVCDCPGVVFPRFGIPEGGVLPPMA
ncbi:hypothetical protein ATCC90586_008021 [Pythium insidiosum]|nr:hypothetical protein ATCC90586_008021 [Pythium insidiosum]